tara:strand:+ start:775 stop:1005 length:231 start_codon:yes stop_codon:yes gene_type:complete
MSQKLELIGFDNHETVKKRRTVGLCKGQLQVGGIELKNMDDGINNIEVQNSETNALLLRIADTLDALVAKLNLKEG